MKTLEQWITIASRGLAAKSAARVRAEIEEHHRSALEAGADEMAALRALGDARAANREYRRVLVTSFEQKMLGWATLGDRHPKSSLAYFLCCALLWLTMGTLSSTWVAIVLAYEGFLVSLPRRGRPYQGAALVAYRCGRYVWLLSLCWAILETPIIPLGFLPVLLGTFAFVGFTELVNARLRRKLPPSDWPKAIYLF